jgi:hypothetical protein
VASSSRWFLAVVANDCRGDYSGGEEEDDMIMLMTILVLTRLPLLLRLILTHVGSKALSEIIPCSSRSATSTNSDDDDDDDADEDEDDHDDDFDYDDDTTHQPALVVAVDLDPRGLGRLVRDHLLLLQVRHVYPQR